MKKSPGFVFPTAPPMPLPGYELAISQERRRYIADLATDEWVDRLPDEIRDDLAALKALSQQMSDETNRFLDAASDPQELHLFADLSNCEVGTEDLKRVVQNPNCDAGTALMVYWRLRPEWFVQFSTAADVPEWARDSFELMEMIEARFRGGGYPRREFPFDPATHGQAGLYAEQLATGRRPVPRVMYEPVGGPQTHGAPNESI